MSYATQRDKLTRTPKIIVKLELDNSISDSGEEWHCFGATPIGQFFYPHEAKGGYSVTPTRMAIASGLGFRGHVKLKFKDFSIGSAGSYFPKLVAANEYYLDRKIKIYTGFYNKGDTFDIADFKEHLYFIKKIEGPDARGNVTITAADPLTLLDDDQAQAPAPSDGVLAGALTDSATGTLDITDNTGFSASGGVANLDGELVRYSGISGGTSIVTTERGAFGSEAKAHDSGDSVHNSYYVESANVVDVIRSLIEDYSPIDHASYIPDADWNTQRDDFLVGELVTGVISEPSNVKEIIESLCEQAYCSVWWDDVAQEIKLKAIGPTPTPNVTLNKTEHILEDGEKQKRDPTKAITEVWIYYGRRDHSKGKADPSNYEYRHIAVDADATTGHGKPKVKKIYASFIPGSGASSASKLGSRILAQNKTGEHKYEMQLDVKDADTAVGDTATIETNLIQDTNGAPLPSDFMIVEKQPITPTKYKYTGIKTGWLVGAKYGLVAPNSMADYTSASQADRLKYAFVADTSSEEMSNGDVPSLII